MNEKTDILIVGAGPVGLMAACQLQRCGIEHRIIDRRAEPNTKSKAAGVWCRSMDIFDELGLAEQFMEQGNQCASLIVLANGKELGGMDLSEIRSRFNFLLILPQDQTEKILRAHYASLGGSIEMATELVGLSQDDAGVTAQLKTATGESTVACQYLIASDGISSTTRELLGMPFDGKAIPADWIVGDVTVDGSVSDEKVSAFLHESGPCVFFPFGNRRFRIVGYVPERKGENPTLEEFQEMIDERTQMPITFSDMRDLAYFRIQERQVKQYRVGRCFFGGDAAHVHSPAGGQGMNTGLQDTHNLAWKLALAVQGHVKDDTFLDSYHLERHPIAEEVLSKTGGATELLMLKNPLLQSMRNHAMSFMLSLPVVQNKGRDTMSQSQINYREGPLAQGEKEGWFHKKFAHADIKPGDFFHDAVLTVKESEESVRLTEKLRPARFHLLLLNGEGEQEMPNLAAIAKETADAWPGLVETHLIVNSGSSTGTLDWDGDVLVDSANAAHEAYHAEAATACLIRPDGYIAYIAHQPEPGQVKAYFDKIGIK